MAKVKAPRIVSRPKPKSLRSQRWSERDCNRAPFAVGTKPGLTPGASNWEMLEVFRVAAEFRAPVVDHQRDTRTDQATLETRGLLGIEVFRRPVSTPI